MHRISCQFAVVILKMEAAISARVSLSVSLNNAAIAVSRPGQVYFRVFIPFGRRVDPSIRYTRKECRSCRPRAWGSDARSQNSCTELVHGGRSQRPRQVPRFLDEHWTVAVEIQRTGRLTGAELANNQNYGSAEPHETLAPFIRLGILSEDDREFGFRVRDTQTDREVLPNPWAVVSW